jgi:hypothetical protein
MFVLKEIEYYLFQFRTLQQKVVFDGTTAQSRASSG